MRPNVWIEVSGLPQEAPRLLQELRLRAPRPEDDLRHRLARRARPGSTPRCIANLDLERETLERIFYKNALRVYERMEAGNITTIDID